jgi:MSHA biogenesis protein MshP
MNSWRSSGMALPVVIFLMVIVTLLIGYMSRIVSSQTAATNLELLGTQAYWSAQSANEWAAHQINATSACPVTPSNFSINGFSILVSCTRTAYLEASSSGAIYEVSARATLGSAPGQLDYVSRTVEMVLDVQ